MRKITTSNMSVWGELEYPTEFFNSPDGKIPLEIYVQNHPVQDKIKYETTVSQLIKSAPPRFIILTKTCDYGLKFKNGIEIKGVHHKLWHAIPFTEGMNIITKKVRLN